MGVALLHWGASANVFKPASIVSPFTKFEVREVVPYERSKNTLLKLGRTRARVATQQLVSTGKTTGRILCPVQ